MALLIVRLGFRIFSSINCETSSKYLLMTTMDLIYYFILIFVLNKNRSINALKNTKIYESWGR